MRLWSGVTLQGRVKLIHRAFPDRRISATHLAKIYRRHGITKKKIRQDKIPPSLGLQTYFVKVQNCRQQVTQARSQGRPNVFCDETVFTRRTYQYSDFACKYQYHKVDLRDI